MSVSEKDAAAPAHRFVSSYREEPCGGLRRCRWVNLKNEKYVRYHDFEWGRPVRDDRKLFEMLLLESFQAGLSWECVLNKREAFRRAFDGFDWEAVASYGDEKVAALALDASIIRNRLKIKAAVRNAAVFKEIRGEYGSFCRYLRERTGEDVIVERGRSSSPLSDAISKELTRRGMKFAGSTIIYSYLQAVGIIWSHDEECFVNRRAGL